MLQKNKYVITLLYTVQKDVEVEAKSLEEAKEKALSAAGPDLKTGDGTLTAFCKTLFLRDNKTGRVLYRGPAPKKIA